ncbi:MAG TPA: hemerythrin family protein [Thermoanaerobaculia bacterium]
MSQPNALHEIGIPQVDSEHAMQFQLFSGLEQALAAGDRESALQMLVRLYDFSDAHFGSEQVLMRFHSYPGYAAHEREHGDLLEELRQLIDLTRESDLSELPERAESVRRWLVSHIDSSDRAFASYLRRVAPASLSPSGASAGEPAV